MLTLHHFTSPRWFAEKGAFAAAGAETVFGRFARRAAARWGGQVRLWCTINEPLVLVTGTYLAGVMPASGTSLVQGYRAYLGLVRAHDAAYRALHEVAGTGVSVGFAHNMIDFMPARSRKIRDRAASAIVSRVYNRAWLDAVDADFVGVNYYTKGYVRFGAQPHAEYGAAGLPLSVALALPDEPQSDLGWAVHPRGLGKILDAVARTGKPVYVTENGIADAADRLRPQYLRAHVEEVRRALARGVDVRGYFHWSLLDNFEWHLGFGPRFGLYQVDYETLERTPRASAKLYAELIRSFE